MTLQRLALGTVVGGLVLFFLGYLVYGVLFAGFFATNVGTATGVAREPFGFIALAIGQLAFSAALTLIFNWASIRSAGQGAKAGALIGLLVFLGLDLTMYATTNIQNLTASLVDPLLAAVLFAVSSAAIVLVSRPKATA